MKRYHKSNERRNRQYKRLKTEGFNSREANRYKDLSDRKIDELIEQKRKAKADECKIVGDCND